MRDECTEHACRLAATLRRAAVHRHNVHDAAWSPGFGQCAFDVELCDGDDLPSGLTARVIVSVTPS